MANLAAADDGSLHVRMLHENASNEPLLHLDPTMAMDEPSLASPSDSQHVQLAIGPHARFTAEGKWWEAGISPSEYAFDARERGWRGAAELTYDVGWFSLGANVSMTQDITGTHRTAGLFAYKRFNLSRWMHAWIALGLSFEQWEQPGQATRSGTTLGLSLGTTFR